MNRFKDAYPDWMPRPKCPVFLVVGPPGGGKTTYCNSARRSDDVFIDLDECFVEACGTHGHSAEVQFLSDAIEVRNRKLLALQGKASGKAFFICCAPTDAERAWWVSLLGATVVEIAPPLGAILDRPNVNPQRKVLAHIWYDERAAGQWAGPARLQRTDGW